MSKKLYGIDEENLEIIEHEYKDIKKEIDEHAEFGYYSERTKEYLTIPLCRTAYYFSRRRAENLLKGLVKSKLYRLNYYKESMKGIYFEIVSNEDEIRDLTKRFPRITA